MFSIKDSSIKDRRRIQLEVFNRILGMLDPGRIDRCGCSFDWPS